MQGLNCHSMMNAMIHAWLAWHRDRSSFQPLLGRLNPHAGPLIASHVKRYSPGLAHELSRKIGCGDGRERDPVDATDVLRVRPKESSNVLQGSFIDSSQTDTCCHWLRNSKLNRNSFVTTWRAPVMSLWSLHQASRNKHQAAFMSTAWLVAWGWQSKSLGKIVLERDVRFEASRRHQSDKILHDLFGHHSCHVQQSERPRWKVFATAGPALYIILTSHHYLHQGSSFTRWTTELRMSKWDSLLNLHFPFCLYICGPSLPFIMLK